MPGVGEMAILILMDAVQRGLVEEKVIDEMVRRILRVVFLARQDGWEPTLEPEAGNTPENRALAREAAGEAIVLLKNEGSLLPIHPGKIRSIAVFGPTAATASVQGGGSAFTNPYYTISPLEAIQSRVGEKIRVTYRQGCKNNIHPPAIDSRHVVASVTGEPGFLGQYFANCDFTGEPFLTRVDEKLVFYPSHLPVEQTRESGLSARWQGTFVAPVSGEFAFSLSSAGQSRLLVDGQLVTDHWNDPNLGEFMSVWPFQAKIGRLWLEAGKSYDLLVEYSPCRAGTAWPPGMKSPSRRMSWSRWPAWLPRQTWRWCVSGPLTSTKQKGSIGRTGSCPASRPA